jgi:ribose 1,5-bisphosphokinase
MTGGFVLVVGPSGAGKDTLIAFARKALVHDARFLFPRRLVTRPSSAFEQHDTFTEEDFEHGLAAGAFALSWRAHGLGYALSKDVAHQAERGHVVVANVSRLVIGDAVARFGSVGVIEVTAPEAVLRQRLAARSREGEDVASRLARASIATTAADLRIYNDQSPESSAAQLIAFLQGFAGRRLVAQPVVKSGVSGSPAPWRT